ncbi:hypothetical protein CPLU01_01622 [Colletotrichum plurivorum]|uniref:RING-type domain-containing protein n=1 Tax=Colletotrichum plurivorum TaxID=2175906 RepID=A0A8H6NNR4_9PEZI|nr:hypothetical protein CPLU01_01622 [Colletotrichum plurivorum]
MPGLIPFLPTPPQPQHTQATSPSARPSILDSDQGAARGSSQQAPIELDDSDSDSAPTSGLQTTTAATAHSQQHHNLAFDQQAWNWAGLPTPNSSGSQQALPSFSDFAATLGLAAVDAPHTPAREPNSDDYLNALIDGVFSSPSSYPPSAQPPSDFQLANGSSSRNQPASSGAPTQPIHALDSLRTFVANITQNTNAPVASTRRPTQQQSYQDDEVEESLFVSSDDDFDNMPVQTRRRASTAVTSDHEHDEAVTTSSRKRAAPGTAASRGTPASNKRQKASQASTTRTRATPRQEAAPEVEDDDDVFGEKDGSKGKEKDGAGDDVIDLAASDEVPKEMVIPKEDKRIKLSAFQCVICMDDVTSLTVTHCGHLFCSECLHSALNVDATRNKCPICRQKVETKDRSDYGPKTKGFWPLELKLMTASRKGKQKA